MFLKILNFFGHIRLFVAGIIFQGLHAQIVSDQGGMAQHDFSLAWLVAYFYSKGDGNETGFILFFCVNRSFTVHNC